MTLVQIVYTALTLFVTLFMVSTYWKGMLKLEVPTMTIRKRLAVLIIGLATWFVYLYFIGESGVLWVFTLPPRFPLLVFVPLALFSTILFIRNRKSQLFLAVPKAKIIYFQAFRIFVELAILGTYMEGIFPIETTFEGYNYEIIIGLLAPLVAFGVYHKKWFSENVALAFNYLGLTTLAIIIFIVISSLYFPSFWGDSAPRIGQDFTRVPYLLLPGFLAPMAIIAHVFSIIQIRRSKKS